MPPTERPLSDSHGLSQRNNPRTHSQYSSGQHVSGASFRGPRLRVLAGPANHVLRAFAQPA